MGSASHRVPSLGGLALAVSLLFGCASGATRGGDASAIRDTAAADTGSGNDARADAADGGPSDGGGPDVDGALADVGTSDADVSVQDVAISDAGLDGSTTPWQELGPGFTAMPNLAASEPSITFDTTGRPVVAFMQLLPIAGNNSHRVFVYRWTGASWETLGSPYTGDNAYSPHVFVHDGNLYLSLLSWSAGVYTALVYRYQSGTNWAQPATIAIGVTTLPHLSTVSYGTSIWTAFSAHPNSDINMPMSVFAYQQNTTGTFEMRATAAPLTGTSSNATVLLPTLFGTSGLYLATLENGSARARAYTGGAFTALGSMGEVPLPAGSTVTRSTGFVGPSATVGVAVASYTSGEAASIYLTEFGSSWSRWAGPISAFSAAGSRTILLDAKADSADNVYVAFSESENNLSNAPEHLFVYRCNRNTTTCVQHGAELNGNIAAGSDPRSAALHIGSDQHVTIAWSETTGTSGYEQIFVSRFN